MRQFVPLTDDMVVASPEKLVPYQVGQPCFHWEVDDAFELVDEIAELSTVGDDKLKSAATG